MFVRFLCGNYKYMALWSLVIIVQLCARSKKHLCKVTSIYFIALAAVVELLCCWMLVCEITRCKQVVRTNKKTADLQSSFADSCPTWFQSSHPNLCLHCEVSHLWIWNRPCFGVPVIWEAYCVSFLLAHCNFEDSISFNKPYPFNLNLGLSFYVC